MGQASDQRRSRTTRVRGVPTGRRRTPSQQRSRDTVEVLLEAAAQVFDREGAGATTNRIAERAGVSIGTLYQYFPDKTGMLQALADIDYRGWVVVEQDVLPGQGDPGESTRRNREYLRRRGV